MVNPKPCPRCSDPPTRRAESSPWGPDDPQTRDIVIVECRPCMWEGPGGVYYSGFGVDNDEANQAWNKHAGNPYRND